MSKKINFATMNEATMNVKSFSLARINIATEDVRYKKALEPLTAELNTLLESRKKALESGESVDAVSVKFSRVDIDNRMNALKIEHDKIVEPLNEICKTTYALIPAETYESYVKKITDDKRGDFLKSLDQFVKNLGIEDFTDGAIRKLSESMSNKLGARISSSKNLLKDGKFTGTMSKQAFNKLFMSAFADILISKGAYTIESLAE